MSEAAPTRDFDVVLVLSGGNALGAFEAGVYEALHRRGLYPDWIIGASIGAINGALIAGSAVERRLDTLRAFWRPESVAFASDQGFWFADTLEAARRTAAVGWTMMAGRPGIFGPVSSRLASWSTTRQSFFETEQLAATLDRMVDFDLLNAGGCRYTATAVDLATGDDVFFDSSEQRIGADHIRASAALPVAFPPIEIAGRWLVDGGLSANLPLDPLLAKPPLQPVLCIAVDLLPLDQALPHTLGESASRMQDLIFAAQSRRSIARWQAAYAGREDVGITLVRIAYVAQAQEVAGKAMDFSGQTIRQRWEAGHDAATTIFERSDLGAIAIASRGMHVLTE